MTIECPKIIEKNNQLKVEGTEEEVIAFIIYLWPELYDAIIEGRELEDDEGIDE
jgi:hypothetical protein